METREIVDLAFSFAMVSAGVFALALATSVLRFLYLEWKDG